eukprot:364353-Chlamydomonas_euryale.AAC.3
MLKTPGLTGSTASALSRAHHPFRLSTSVIPLKTGAPSERLPQFEVHVFNVGVCRRLGCYQCMRVCAGVCAGGKGGRLPPQLLLHSRCPAAQAARAAPATAAAAPSPDSQRSFQVLASPPRALEESNTTQPSQNERVQQYVSKAARMCSCVRALRARQPYQQRQAASQAPHSLTTVSPVFVVTVIWPNAPGDARQSWAFMIKAAINQAQRWPCRAQQQPTVPAATATHFFGGGGADSGMSTTVASMREAEGGGASPAARSAERSDRRGARASGRARRARRKLRKARIEARGEVWPQVAARAQDVFADLDHHRVGQLGQHLQRVLQALHVLGRLERGTHRSLVRAVVRVLDVDPQPLLEVGYDLLLRMHTRRVALSVNGVGYGGVGRRGDVGMELSSDLLLCLDYAAQGVGVRGGVSVVGWVPASWRLSPDPHERAMGGCATGEGKGDVT